MHQVSPLPEGELPHLAAKKIGEYQLAGIIGKGNFGEVFLAEDSNGVQNALKIFIPRFDDHRNFDLEYDGMFLTHKLQNEYLVPVEYVGRTEYCIYYTMPLADSLSEKEYIPHTLYNRMIQNDLDEKELLQMTSNILSALAYLHDRKLIHRDIKPDNIFKINGVWCLGDTGSLAFSRPKNFTGTPGFYPEKKNFRADEVSDLYALGKTLYCAATGMKPEHYPLVPENYDYSRYAIVRRIYRNSIEGKYKTANQMRKDVEDVYLCRNY
jgi:serine/threonine protein kinase